MNAIFGLVIFGTVLIGLSIPNSMIAADTSKPWAWRGQTLTEFTKGGDNSLDWQVVNDGVMGGLSRGSFSITDEGTMIFSGNLSLENNGGFSSVRSSTIDRNLSNDLGILVRVKGDGREYKLRLDSDATYRGMPASFSGTFQTSAGQWKQIKVPFSAFKCGWRGRDLPDEKLNTADIRRVGILLGDKKSGPFKLEVDYIRTYGKGQGSYSERDAKPTTDSTLSDADGPKSLIDTAVADGRFNTFKAALDAARLTTFFQWDNKLTVFAPTDEAFAKLPEGTLENLLKPENRQQLVSILSLHVHPGSLDLATALSAGDVKTVEGTPLKVAFKDGKVRVNDAALINADVQCADGTIHVIDQVLLPVPKRKTLISTAEQAGTFSTLLAAVKAAGLDTALSGEQPLTIFAPTDEAFAALPSGTVGDLLKIENRSRLTDLLTSHVVAGNVTAGDALTAGVAKSLSGSTLTFGISDGLFNVNGSVIRDAGIDAGNGMIHVISSVIGFPETSSSCDSRSCPSACEKEEARPAPETTSVEANSDTDLILAAIEKGVPLYNSGNAQACADLYEDCLAALSESEAIDPRTRKMLTDVARAGKKHDANSRAWFYRHALDRMVQMLALRS